MLYWGYDYTMIILLPAILLTVWAQAKVKGTFRRYSEIRNSTGLTGAMAARRVLDASGLTDVTIRRVSGSLTDYYDPRSRSLHLSDDVYGVDSIAAVGVACHEAGHAVQHARHYMPLIVRNSIVPVVNFASSISWILIMIGLGMLFATNQSAMGDMLFNLGVICFGIVVLFHLITLPVELNASRRAVNLIGEYGLVAPSDLAGCRKVLKAAAMTYVAALAVAVANLLRILLIRGNRD